MASTSRSRSAEVVILRETILRYVNRRVGKTAAQLLIDVRDDFGSVDERRFYRQLSYLAEVGCVRRNKDTMTNWERQDSAEDGRSPLVYFYYLTGAPLPPAEVRHCSICGVIGAQATSHPLHLRLRRELGGRPFRYLPITSAERQTSAGSPDSPPPAETSAPPDHPRSAARRAS